jgi:hypothetical protein
MLPATVGNLRKLIEGMDDSASVYPDWSEIPDDIYPGVEVTGLDVAEGLLLIKVRLFGLDKQFDCVC